MCSSTNVSPHHRLHHHHHMHLHRSHSRVQSLDLMDDIPPLFQTDKHHLNLLVQESPMLSPNPPPSVVESNGQNLPQPIIDLTTITSQNDIGQTSTVTHEKSYILSNSSNFNSAMSTTTTNVIINNIKTNTTTVGTANLDSGIFFQQSTTVPVKNSEYYN